MTEIIPTVGVLVYKNDDVLLVKHTKVASHLTGMYGLPAGKIENNETEKEAAIRELKEETGIITLDKDLVEIPKKYIAKILQQGGMKIFSFKVFICKKWKGKIRGTKKTIPQWIKISHIDKYKLLPNVEDVVNESLKYRKI